MFWSALDYLSIPYSAVIFRTCASVHYPGHRFSLRKVKLRDHNPIRSVKSGNCRAFFVLEELHIVFKARICSCCRCRAFLCQSSVNWLSCAGANPHHSKDLGLKAGCGSPRMRCTVCSFFHLAIIKIVCRRCCLGWRCCFYVVVARLGIQGASET
jgi:hypothetical protein